MAGNLLPAAGQQRSTCLEVALVLLDLLHPQDVVVDRSYVCSQLSLLLTKRQALLSPEYLEALLCAASSSSRASLHVDDQIPEFSVKEGLHRVS